MEGYALCAMMIRLEVWKITSLQVCMLCAMMISFDVLMFGSLQIVCDDDRLGSL